ncbi:MAG: ABC transporter ATP-binding protein [Kiritimatiellae bacterium]|nr:ABC transporter ATP-binding protein [Kiritimatiellia bacterium]
MIASAVSTRALTKRYGKRKALDGFTLDVPAGSIMGLVGRNGSGKTTWMMSVAGLVRPGSGEINLLGRGPFDASVHSGRIAILPQDSELPLEMTPLSLLSAFARLQGLGAKEAKASAQKALESVNLSDRARASIRSLSHGMRKRVMTAQCFLGEPELVLLDEPMNGLDPEEAERMRNFILSGLGRRTTVISSHNLLDLGRIATHVAFVEDGKVSRVATMKELSDSGKTLEEAYLGR